jgi:hypothetical protein
LFRRKNCFKDLLFSSSSAFFQDLSLSSFSEEEFIQGSSLLFFLFFLARALISFGRRRLDSTGGKNSVLSLLRFEPHLFLHLSMRFSRKSKTLLHFCSVNQSKLQGCTSPHSKTAVQTELYVFCSHQLVVVHSDS